MEFLWVHFNNDGDGLDWANRIELLPHAQDGIGKVKFGSLDVPQGRWDDIPDSKIVLIDFSAYSKKST